jgi:circadian clock protein KaiC
VRISSGISGFDALSGGGIPQGRITLLTGGPGCGKTLAALQMLAGTRETPGAGGVFVSFEEDLQSLLSTASGFDSPLQELLDTDAIVSIFPVIAVDAIQSGPFDIEGLLALLEPALDRAGARIVVLDGVDALLSQLNDETVERRELQRIRQWAVSKGITALITAKGDSPDDSTSERYGFLHYLVDCVILLQHNLKNGIASRSIRVLKSRGTAHSSNEYPLLIGKSGIVVVGSGSKNLSYPVSNERVSSGLDRLDVMLGGGYYKGSSILISGLPGSAKTTLAGLLAAETVRRGERVIFISFDEASQQIVRNLKSVKIDLEAAEESGLLIMASFRNGTASVEEYYRDICDLTLARNPSVLVIDPISDFAKAGGSIHGVGIAERLLDFVKSRGITSLFTSLITETFAEAEATVAQISTLADSWMQVSFRVRGGERNRALSIMKSRGMHHSNQVRELILSEEGVSLADVYSSGGDVLMGTARAEREAADAAAELARQEEFGRVILELEREQEVLLGKGQDIEAQIALKRARLETLRELEATRIARKDHSEEMIKRMRQADQEELEGAHGH